MPSEAWAHTIFFNSKYANNAISKPAKKYNGLSELSPLSYFEYGTQIKILNETDYENIINSNKLFARKILVGKSDKLIEILGKH